MIKTLTNISISRPRTVYSALLIISLICLALFPRIEIDTDPENMLSPSNKDRLFHNSVKNEFSMFDKIIIGVVNESESGIYNPKSLQAILTLSDKINTIEHVLPQEQLSLSTIDNITQGEFGGISFQWLMKNAPNTFDESKAIKTAVMRLPLLANTLVSADGKAAVIYVAIDAKSNSYKVAQQVRSTISTLNVSDKYFISGLPIAEDQFGTEMFVQMGIAAPMAGLAIFILMWVFFRSVKLITGPMVVAMATVVITMGLLIGMGFTVHIMSSMIAIFLMPIAVVDSTHILSEFADEYREGKDPKIVIKDVTERLFTPMLYTSLTSAVGFMSLMLTPIPPVKVFGGFIAFGILLAFIITIIFIPAYISRLSPKQLYKLHTAMAKQESGRLQRFLVQMGRFSVNRKGIILLGFSALFIISAIGITRIQVNDNPINWFKSNHEIRVADSAINEHFGGTYDAWFVLDGINSGSDTIQPMVAELLNQNIINNSQLKKINAIESLDQKTQELILLLDDKMYDDNIKNAPKISQYISLLEIEQQQRKTFLFPENLVWMQELQDALIESNLVGKVNGLPDIVKTVNRELNGGHDSEFILPKSNESVAQALLQYQSSHRPQDLWHFVTPSYQKSLMWLQLTSGDNLHMSNVISFVEEYVQKHPLPNGITYGWAGKTYLNVIWQKAMVNGMLESLISAFVVVFLMMVLLFRSIKFGLLAMLPLSLTITFIYGLIGWIGKDYDMPIAVLSALTLGLSVDFSIHFIERFRSNLKHYQSVQKTLNAMFKEPARAISRNTIIIAVGFMPLLAAPLVPYITVGFFLASIMALSGIVTLLLLPSILSFKRDKL